MSKKKTHEEYVDELKQKNPTVEVIGKYIDADTSIMHHCLQHNVFWSTAPSRVLRGAGCEKCRIEKFRRVRCKTHEQYITEVSHINKDIVVIGEYVDARTPIDHYCKKHNIVWKSYPDNILRGIGCKECGNEKIRDKNIKTHNEYVEELSMINPNIDVIEEYRGANISILHHCKIDGHIWAARPGNILFGKGCPKCNDSHGEKQICRWLYDNNINYISQKTFNDCRNKRLLSFDFYLPDYNICIEYDGEQHFRPVDIFGGEEGFQQRQINDDIKTKYCISNNISLLRIPYNKNIDEELNNFFIHLI